MILEKQIKEAFKQKVHRRCDDMGVAYYFSAKDFPTLSCEEFSFKSRKGDLLQGYFYSYADYKNDRIIVFDHGFGGGHLSYMREIEKLCSRGYLVFAYDHTGCMQSEGVPCGFTQSLCDLDDAIKALRANEKCKNLDFSVVGHSWGGFAVMNICALCKDISHIVAIAGFIGAKEMIKQNFSGILSPYEKAILSVETEANPEFIDFDARVSLADTQAKVLLIYSDSDKLVKKENHYDKLKSALSGRENITFILEKDKGHNPNYTKDAVLRLGEYLRALAKKGAKLKTEEEKREFVSSFDWEKMTEQDEQVWEKIFKHLEK